MSIESRLRELDRAGELRHLLLARSGDRYQASYKNADGSYRVEHDANPVTAVLAALGKPADDFGDLLG